MCDGKADVTVQRKQFNSVEFGAYLRIFCTHRALEALLAIFEQGKRNWAVVDVCARRNKDGSE